MKESEIQRGIMQAFRRAGWKVWRLQAGTARGGRTHMAEAGAPDLVCLAAYGRTYPRLVLVEVKSGDGELRAAQKETMAWCKKYGYEYRIMRRVGDVEEVL